MYENFAIASFLMIIFAITHLTSILVKSKPWAITTIPSKLVTQNDPSNLFNLHDDPEAIKLASSDHGHIYRKRPQAVLYPNSITEIASLIKFANNVSIPFKIAARGQGHSIRGQAMVGSNGIVVNMMSLRNYQNGSGVIVSISNCPDSLGNYNYFYADVGGEQLWVDVLHATLEYGLAPVSWTDYLRLTIGGTLSNAGISGQTFRFGPQISNVYEMDVITGKGEIVTCSAENNSELYYAVLGGLGQFGIIARARIALELAPKRVKWVRMLYNDFSSFIKDQEHLISINGRTQNNALDYLEGLLLLNQGPPDNWRSSFFPSSDHSRIISQVTKHKIIYCLEIAKYYNDYTEEIVDQELEKLFEGLSYMPGFLYKKELSFVEFLDRVHSGELKLQSQGLWDVPHPWLNLFVPASRISDFNEGVFKDIVLKRNITTGPVLLYPMNKNKWDDRMSAVIPEEEVFYAVGFLHSSGFNNWKYFDDQNIEILEFCKSAGIKVKQYLPHYQSKKDWIDHFGPKWDAFLDRKTMFDPLKILSPGQRIFSTSPSNDN